MQTINGSYTEHLPKKISLADFFAPVFENKSGYEQVMEETVGKPVYLIERYEINKGIFQHIQGHPYPQKGIPPQADAIFAANQVKKLILESCTLFGFWLLFLNKRKAIASFRRLSWKTISPYMVKYDYMTNTSQGVYDFATALMVNLGYAVKGPNLTAKALAMIVELDSAYSFRLKDLCNETDELRLYKKPITELRRLLRINSERDYLSQHAKFKTAGRLLTIALLYPPFRRAFRTTLKEIDFSKLQMDRGDKYWACFKEDYKYLGMTYEQRQELAKTLGN